MLDPFGSSIGYLARWGIQLLTGRLLTEEQIHRISHNAVGSYFADFFPTPAADAEAANRVEQARAHVQAASAIITDLNYDLERQSKQLDQLVKDIEEKRSLAERYEVLAQTNQKAFAAYKVEMEGAVARQLRAEAAKGRGLRRTLSSVMWTVTLILGAALGAKFDDVVRMVTSVVRP